MASVTFFGTGAGTPSGVRFHSSSWVEVGEDTLLVDAGEPCSNRILAKGLDITQPSAVLITHAHCDHIAGLPMFLQGNWLAKRREPLAIYMPEFLIGPFESWLETVYIPPRLLGFDVTFIPWESHEVHEVGRCRIEAVSTSHLDGLCHLLDPNHPERFRAYALGIAAGGCRLVFSGDLGTPQDLGPLLNDPADLLVCELSHFGEEDLQQFLLVRSVRHLALTHLSQRLAGDELRVERETAAMLPEIGTVRVVEDGDVIEL